MKVIRDHPERRFQVGNALASERAMIKALLEGDGFRPGITFEDAELHGVRAPTLMIFGAADPTGDRRIWQRFVDQLPQGELKTIEGLGHMPWWDDPFRVAGEVSGFLRSA